MSRAWQISRRTVLRGLGTAVALPLLDAMAPARWPAAADGDSKPRPMRMAFVYVPNGMHMPDWTPAAEGADFELPYILEPLAERQERLAACSAAWPQDKAAPHGDGAGDHARALASVPHRRAAAQDGRRRHPRRRLGRPGRRRARSASRPGFPRSNSAASAARRPATATPAIAAPTRRTSPGAPTRRRMAKEVDPKLVFERLFASGADGRAAQPQRETYRKSVLDFVLEDARDLRSHAGRRTTSASSTST